LRKNLFSSSITAGSEDPEISVQGRKIAPPSTPAVFDRKKLASTSSAPFALMAPPTKAAELERKRLWVTLESVKASRLMAPPLPAMSRSASGSATLSSNMLYETFADTARSSIAPPSKPTLFMNLQRSTVTVDTIRLRDSTRTAPPPTTAPADATAPLTVPSLRRKSVFLMVTSDRSRRPSVNLTSRPAAVKFPSFPVKTESFTATFALSTDTAA